MWDTLLELCQSQESQHVLGWVERGYYIVFYANYGHIAGRNRIWVQGTFMTLIWMFEQVGTSTNMGNTKFMTFTPVFVWWKIVKEAYKLQEMGEGATIW